MTEGRQSGRDAARSPFDDLEGTDGDGPIACGGSIEPGLVLDAYRHGVFPWYASDDRAPLWWSPDPRAVLPLDALHVPRRLERVLRSGRFAVSTDQAFEAVVRACAHGRVGGTWIHEEMISCYGALHRLGHAHSLEVREEGELVGGIYGVAFGSAFAAESMFHRRTDASKVALVALARRLRDRGCTLFDTQFLTPHLASFGVTEIPRSDYLARVRAARDRPTSIW